MQELVVGLLSAFAVWVFYRALETAWPDTYFAAASTTDPVINRTLPRYLLWRLGPVVVGAMTVAVTVERLGGEVLAACAVFWIAHVGSSIGRALWWMAKGKDRTPDRVVLRLAVLVGTFAATWVGLLLRSSVGSTVPPPQALLEGVWVAALTSVLAVFLQRLSQAQREPSELVRRSRSELSDALIQEAHEAARRHSADPRIVESVMLVENLQRPAWVRWLERRKSPVWPTGTYGVMQVSNGRPLSDSESIVLAVERHLAGIQIRGSDYSGQIYRDTSSSLAAMVDYNASPEWQSLLSDVLSEIIETEGFSKVEAQPAASTAIAADGSPVLDLEEASLEDDGIVVKGSFLARGTLVTCEHLGVDGELLAALEETVTGAVEERRAFVMRIAPRVGTVALVFRLPQADEVNDLVPACRFRLSREWRRALL